MIKNIRLLCLSFLIFITSTTRAQTEFNTDFRGVWIATVKNIDWPKEGVINPKSQKQDFIQILDYYDNLNFNAVIVQIRTAGDAFYPSKLAPWSMFLTGNQGIEPIPYYDPLKFMIEETHKRGMEFHAWLNPYRATTDLNTTKLSDDHVYNQHPEWIVKYGNNYYLNPGNPEVRSHFVSIIDEVVTNYDVDAIHFDDYFYPYKVEDERFEDIQEYINFGMNYQQELEDWRRSNVDSLVKEVHHKIKSIKPWVKFGISPFGVWRNKSEDPKGSNTRALQTNYDDLYADPLCWIKNEWIDYIVPQIYWSMDYDPAPYRELIYWWSRNAKGIPVYAGIGAHKVQNNHDKAWNDLDEIPSQLRLNASIEGIEGTVFFSAKSLMSKDQLAQILKSDYFNSQAVSSQNDSVIVVDTKPDIERIQIIGDVLSINWKNIPDKVYDYIMIIKEIEPANSNRYQIIEKIQLDKTNSSNLILQKKDSIYLFAFLDQYDRISKVTSKVNVKFKKGNWKAEISD